jgi:hypothetical protein
MLGEISHSEVHDAGPMGQYIKIISHAK